MIPIWGFLAVTLPLVLTPGASTAIVLRNSLDGGSRAGIETAAGVNSGSILYGMISAFGLAYALRRWPSVWLLLRIAGIGYLVWLGLRSIQNSIRPSASSGAGSASAGVHVQRPLRQNVYEGFLTNALNPSIASFYLVVVPQFAPPGMPFARSVLALTAIHVTIAVTWHVVWAVAGGTMARLAHGRPRQLLDACAGAAMLALALKMAI